MPNCPDPSTSSENIWYTEAISYRDNVNCYCFTALSLRSFRRWLWQMETGWSSEARENAAFGKGYLLLENIKLSLTEKLNSEKPASYFVLLERFCRQNFWFDHSFIRIWLCRLHKEIWEKPLKKPHSPHSPGSGSWTLICWWTAPLERKAWKIHVKSGDY